MNDKPQRRPTSRRRYTPEERRAVLADVGELGIMGAARKHGIPITTVSQWHSGKRAAKSLALVDEPAVSHTEPRPNAEASSQIPAATPTSTSTPDPKAPHQRNVAKRYTPSQRAEIVEYAASHGVHAAAQQFGVSRFSIYQWQRKVAKAALGNGDAPTCGPTPTDIEAQRDAEILGEWKRHPGLGPSQIRNQLRRKSIKVSVHTVRRVMEDAGYRPPKIKRTPHDQRFEAVRPNHLWHMDFVHRHINRANVFTLILLDDYSRYVVGHGVDDAERASMVIATFEEAVSRHGKPERVMHDRGSAFWAWRGISRFTAFLDELGIDQIVAEDKELNGKSEVFNANLQKEMFDVHHFYDLAEMRRRLAAHLHWYNHARTNHALGGLLVPADRYYGRADEVLRQIESGAGRELGDGLELRERNLELFKISSRNGVPEIWLMGQRLMRSGKDPS